MSVEWDYVSLPGLDTAVKMCRPKNHIFTGNDEHTDEVCEAMP